MNNLLGITKRPLKGITSTVSVSLKPASHTEGAKNPYAMTYVTAQGSEVSEPCTQSCFLRIHGDTTYGVTNGLDMDLKKDFVILKDKAKKIVIGVHTYPKNTFQRGLIPTHLQGKDTMEIHILPTGEFDVMSLPSRIPKVVIVAILSALDPLEELNVGDKILGKHPIVSSGGNILHIKPVGLRAS